MLFAALLGLAVVSSTPYEAEYKACLDKEFTSQNFDYVGCGMKWVAQEEADLSTVWKRTYGTYDTPQVKADLLEEQRNWIKYKDSSCKFLGEDAFGSNGKNLEAPRCRALVIQNRIDQLKSYANPSGY